MTITETADLKYYERAIAAQGTAAREVFETELALHDAHQAHIDSWITAASDHLHTAILRHIEAQNLVTALSHK